MIVLFSSISSYNYNFNYKMFSTDTDKGVNILKLPFMVTFC